MKRYEIISLVAAILLIALFAYASASKIADYQIFVFQLSMTLPPFLRPFNATVGWLVPLVEVVIVLALFLEKWRLLGFYASLALLVLFEVFIASMLLSGMDLPCTCGGVISKLSWTQHLLFNAFFMLMTILPIRYRNHPISPSSNIHRGVYN